MDFKSIDLDFIIDWCEKHNKKDWLKTKALEMRPCEIHPKKEVVIDGKTVLRADKQASTKTVMKKITFIQIKTDFVNEFMPEIAPKAKPKKPNMYDRIAAL